MSWANTRDLRRCTAIMWLRLKDVVATSEGQLVLWTAILVILLLVSKYVLGKTRAAPVQEEPDDNEMISKFRELHAKGELSDAEFRTIKTTLGARLKAKIKDNSETG